MHPHAFFFSMFISLPAFVFVCLSFSFCMFVSLFFLHTCYFYEISIFPPSLHLCLSVSLSVFNFLYLCLSVSFSPLPNYIYIHIYIYIYIYIYICIYLNLDGGSEPAVRKEIKAIFLSPSPWEVLVQDRVPTQAP